MLQKYNKLIGLQKKSLLFAFLPPFLRYEKGYERFVCLQQTFCAKHLAVYFCLLVQSKRIGTAAARHSP